MSALLLITQERTIVKLPKKSALLQKKKKGHSGPLVFVLLMFILIELKQKTSPNFKNFFS